MFVSDKLKVSAIPSKIFLDFDVQNRFESQYLTENFELYTQNEKYLFDHINGCRIAQRQEGHIIFINSQIKPIYIIERLKNYTHLWENINNKRRLLFYALKKNIKQKSNQREGKHNE